MKSILVATHHQEAIQLLREALSTEYEVEVAKDHPECLHKFSSRRREFTLIDMKILCPGPPPEEMKKLLQPFLSLFPTAQIIVLCEPHAIEDALKAVKAGASAHMTYPLYEDEVKYVLQGLLESLRLYSELDYLRGHSWKKDRRYVEETHNSKMRKVFDQVANVAMTQATVLLTGETGTGKGVVAQLIHRQSKRHEKPFIHVHCGGIPDTLLESELFGHEKGAFTGAIKRKLGRFEIAHKGTIFLDEVNTISPSAQIKLLQVLQDKIFQRVGGEAQIESDVRVIAATNIDLKVLSERGQFRSDLYYRLNVFPIELPALRERREDIPLLVETFIQQFNQMYPKRIRGVEPQVMEALCEYSWPGNIRELQNLVERAYILETSPWLTPASFPSELFAPRHFLPNIPIHASLSLSEVRRQCVDWVEEQYLKEVLAQNRGKIAASAQVAGITTRQLRKLLLKHKIQKEEFKQHRTRLEAAS